MTDTRPAPPLVVIGGSAGALRAVRRILAELPATLPAMVCVVIHMPDDSASALARVLARAGPMEASFAADGTPLQAGRIAVAPPGKHLLVREGRLVLSQGARENGTRPAIDPLFRSAATFLGPDVVSVILSGTLDDGSAGTVAVRAGGGVTIAVDPADADFPDMPRHAIETGRVSAVLAIDAIPGAITTAVEAMAHRRAAGLAAGSDDDHRTGPDTGATTGPDGPRRWRGDAPAADPDGDPVDRGLGGPAPDLAGPASAYGCPACGGVLYERDAPDAPEHFLCRVGHRYSAEALRVGQEEVVEGSLWTALRTLEESASLAARVRDRAAARGDRPMERRFEDRRVGSLTRADRIRVLLEGQLRRTGEAGGDRTETLSPARRRSA